MRPRLILVAIGCAIVAAVGTPTTGAGTAGPGQFADFLVSIRGNYSLHWAANLSGSCGEGNGTGFLNGSESETIVYATPQPVRVHTIWEIVKFNHRPYPFLVLEDSWHGFHTSTDPRRAYTKFQIDIPAVFERSVSGTYAECGGATQTISAAGCGGRSVPSFVVAIWQEGVTQRLASQATTPYAVSQGDPYARRCVIPGFNGPFNDGPPLLPVGLTGDLNCGGVPHFFSARVGATITCRAIPQKDLTTHGTQKQTETVTFRRVD